MKRLWRKVYSWYVGFCTSHSLEDAECGAKILLSNDVLGEDFREASKVATRVLVNSLDRYLFENKAMIAGAKLRLSTQKTDVGTEVTYRVWYLGLDWIAKLLPMPRWLWRERITSLDKWITKNKPVISKYLLAIDNRI